ncbi:MAG: hypothetical protein EPN97_11890 [Alphaproteobacteria bacterium]|nr:MAG: hypothetical protein EPN97_11890 [Alphaproteobacteria bacterium]
MGQFDKLGKLKEKFDPKSKKEDKDNDETPEWVTKFVDDLRKNKSSDDDMKKSLEAAVAANVKDDGTDAGKKKSLDAASKQVNAEMKKQAKEHPEDESFLKDKSKLLEKGIGAVLTNILGNKNPTEILKKKIKLPF